MLFKPLSIFIIFLSFEFALSDLHYRRRKLVRKNYVELEQERNYLIHYNYTFIYSKLTHNPAALLHKSQFLPFIVQKNGNRTKKHDQFKEIKFDNGDRKNQNKGFFFFSKTKKEKKTHILESFLFDEKEHCKVKLRIPTLRFNVDHVNLCMFLAHWEEDVVENMVVELKYNKTLTMHDITKHNYIETYQDYEFMKKIQPITGYVLNQRGSLVYGYIIDSFFYGQVRLFDMKLNHFIVYYIEPLVNLPLYKPTVNMDDVRSHVRSFKPGANACMFEYLMLTRAATKTPIAKAKLQFSEAEKPFRRGKKVVHSTISPDRERTTRKPKIVPPKPVEPALPPPQHITSKAPPIIPIVYSSTKPRAHAHAPPPELAKQLVYSTTELPAKNVPLTIIRSTPPPGEGLDEIIRSSTPSARPTKTPLTIIHSSEVPEVVGDTIIHSTTVRPTGTEPTPSDLPIIHSTTLKSKTSLPIIHSTTKKTSEGKSFAKVMMGRSMNDITLEADEDTEPEATSPPGDHAPPPPVLETEVPATPKLTTTATPPSTSPPSTPKSTRSTIIFSTTHLPNSEPSVTVTTTVPTKVTTTGPTTVTETIPVTVTTTVPIKEVLGRREILYSQVPMTSSEAFIYSTQTPSPTAKPIIISSKAPERKTRPPYFISSLAPKRVLRPHANPTTPPPAIEVSTKSNATVFFIKSSIAPEKVPRPPFFISTPKPPSAKKTFFKSTLAPKTVPRRKFVSSTVSTADKVTKPLNVETEPPPQIAQQPQSQVQKEEFEEVRVKYTTVKASIELPSPPPPPTTLHYLSTAATRAARRRRRRRAVTYAAIDENDIYASTIKPDENFGEELFERPKPRRSRPRRDSESEFQISYDDDDDEYDEWEHEHVHDDGKPDEELLDDDDDMIEEVMYPKGNKATGRVEVFDLYRAESLLCNLCIWLQPEFALNFGFQHAIHYGAAEIIDLVRYMNWVFRPMDFNMDFRPENIGFRVHKLMVADIPEIDDIPPEEWVGDARKLMPLIKRTVSDKFPDKKCCVILAFVYRNMEPFGSLSSRSAMCVKNKNFALVTGKMMAVKIAKYDVYRFTSHAIGHLIGALNDDSSDTDCYDKNVDTFNNQFIMHSKHQINIGIRPNAMRMSYCSRVKVSVYLSSSRPSCLEPSNYTYCGNGILEEGEDCDCGAPWQCKHIEECCGLRDSFNPCKVINKIPGKICRLPQMMESDFEPEAEGEF